MDTEITLNQVIDERLEDALVSSNYRSAFNIKKLNIKLKFEKDLIYAVNGGIFTISQQLISFTDVLVRRGQTQAVLTDNNNNCVLVENLEEFLDDIIGKYIEYSNAYFTEIKALKTKRTTKAVVGL
jgi:hypothetical protein